MGLGHVVGVCHLLALSRCITETPNAIWCKVTSARGVAAGVAVGLWS